MNWHILLPCLEIHLAIGLLLLLSVCLVPRFREGLFPNLAADMAGAPAWKVALTLALRGGSVVLLWPLVLLRRWRRWCDRSGNGVSLLLPESEPKPGLPPEIDPDELRAWEARNPAMIRPIRIEQVTPGIYDVHCLHCSHVFQYTGLMHGFGENSFLTMGYVCARCHRLAERRWDRAHPKPEHPRCKCGGALRREGQMLCPNCGSPDVCCLYMPLAVT